MDGRECPCVDGMVVVLSKSSNAFCASEGPSSQASVLRSDHQTRVLQHSWNGRVVKASDLNFQIYHLVFHRVGSNPASSEFFDFFFPSEDGNRRHSGVNQCSFFPGYIVLCSIAATERI